MCLRPKAEVSDEHLARLQTAFRENRVTNHSGRKVFPRFPVTAKGMAYSAKVRVVCGGCAFARTWSLCDFRCHPLQPQQGSSPADIFVCLDRATAHANK